MKQKKIYDLAEEIRRCTSCSLWKKRMLAVPGEGKSNAKIMFIGEVPGIEENRQGLPFVGKSGKFLDELLQLIKLKRENIFITNAIKCHPENNRVLTIKEIKTCKELWLNKQIEIINPKLIVLMGNVAVRSIFGKSKVYELHGKLIKKDYLNYFITYHPAAGIRFSKIRTEMIKDFKKLNLLKTRKL
jgi:uracil-DNA glycosylase